MRSEKSSEKTCMEHMATKNHSTSLIHDAVLRDERLTF